MASSPDELRQRLKELNAQIRQLKDERRVIRNALQRARYQPNGNAPYIRTEQLAPVIEEWVQLYNNEHYQGGVSLLAIRAGIDSSHVRKILRVEHQTTSLNVADKLLTAMNANFKLQELDIVSKPRSLPEPPPSVYYEE